MNRANLLIKNALVVDGTGNPWYKASVGVKDGKVAEVGDIAGGIADEVIDAKGTVLCPGFVDMHGHSDYHIIANPTADSKVLQGITTEFAGECGYSSAPIRDKWFQEWWVEDPFQRFSVTSYEKGREVLRRHGIKDQWTDLDEYLSIVEEICPSINYCTFMGHVALRVAVTGDYLKKPDRQELDDMKRLLSEGISQGAYGFSTESGTHRKMDLPTSELEEMFSVSARLGARAAYHLKDYGTRAMEALREGLDLVSKTGARTILSHLSVQGMENWGKGDFVLECIDEARRSGIEVWADVMPYPSSGEALFFSPRAVDMLPQWVADLPSHEISRVLCDSEKRLRLKADLAEGKASSFYYVAREDQDEAYGRGPLSDFHWPYYVRIVESHVPGVVGRTVHEIAAKQGTGAFDTLLDIIRQDPDTKKVLNRTSEEDAKAFAAHPLIGFGTDGGLVGAIRRPGIANPTLYSVFPYVLRQFVFNENLMPLEEAIRKMTSLPCIAHGIRDRGLIRPGYSADLVVFDPLTVSPNVQYDVRMPLPPSRGISLVVVNGQITVREGIHTGARAGKVLRYPGI
jgi:N-acyl-D-amino-acid deacylase